jgi:hypothetical protein
MIHGAECGLAHRFAHLTARLFVAGGPFLRRRGPIFLSAPPKAKKKVGPLARNDRKAVQKSVFGGAFCAPLEARHLPPLRQGVVT